MLEYGALEKALEVVNPKQPNRNGKVKTNRNLRKSNSLTSRPGETDWKVGIWGMDEMGVRQPGWGVGREPVDGLNFKRDGVWQA